MTPADILSAMKNWQEIPVNDICEAVRGSDVKREHLEARLVEAGYFYAIAFDAFMPPRWVAENVVASGGPWPQDLNAIIMDEWGPPATEAERALRPSLAHYYK